MIDLTTGSTLILIVKGMYIKWKNDTSQVKDWNVSTLEASVLILGLSVAIPLVY